MIAVLGGLPARCADVDFPDGLGDIVLDDPVLRHEYLDFANDKIDMDAGGRIGNLGLGEIELDGARDAGDIAASEVLGAVVLVDLTNCYGYVDVSLVVHTSI